MPGDLDGSGGYNGWKAYGQSKLANVLFTYELARRLEGSGVTAGETLLYPVEAVDVLEINDQVVAASCQPDTFRPTCLQSILFYRLPVVF